MTRVVGHSLPRMDAPGKVTGTAVYAADFALPGMLYGGVLRSREPHARLLRIDPSRAARLPGVRAVITAADAADVRYGGSVKDEEVFARDRIRFAGQPLAAVAAVSPDAVAAALAAIDVVCEPLPPVVDVAAALAPGAPLVHEGWAGYTALPILHREGNVCNRARIVVGDVERGFEEADRIFEHRFTTRSVHQGYTEPRAAVAQWDSAGQVTVWSNTQLPFEVQSTLSEILQLPPSRVRIIVPGVGGGFGGKLRIGVEHFAALLARKTGRAVKVMTTCEDELTAAYARQPAIVELKTGVSRDGRILAREGRLWFDTGAFAGSGPGVASVATLMLAGPYRIPNLLLEGFAVYTNKTNFGSFRAPSGPQANFAVESQMDIIADGLGIDPLELRLRNIVREGEEGPTGQVLAAVGLEECLRKVADAIGWANRRPGPGRGKGLACGWWTTSGGSSGVYVKVNPDGTVALNTGAAEIGTAALTGAAQVLAEDLGDRAGRHQRRLGGHPGDAVRLRRAGQPHRVRRRQRVPCRGGGSQGSDRDAGRATARPWRRACSRCARAPCAWPTAARASRWPSWRALSQASGRRTHRPRHLRGPAARPTTPSASRATCTPPSTRRAFTRHAVDLSVDADTGEVTHPPVRGGPGRRLRHEPGVHRGTDRGWAWPRGSGRRSRRRSCMRTGAC